MQLLRAAPLVCFVSCGSQTPPVKHAGLGQRAAEASLERARRAHHPRQGAWVGKFHQRFVDSAGASRESKGRIVIKSCDRYRLEYQVPEKKHFVRSRSVLWIWEIEEKAAFRVDSMKFNIFDFLCPRSGKTEGRQIQAQATRGSKTSARTVDLRIVSKRDELGPSASISLRKSDGLISRYSPQIKGSTNILNFSDWHLDMHIAEAAFDFKPPQGVKVKDATMRPSQGKGIP
jgi:outer membrane lipoprotein-sorting protein